MPVFFQHQINDTTRLGIWKIEETEAFFKGNVPQHRDVTHPHKRLQHLAGRFLLQFLYPGFPYNLIEIADTRKPFLPGEEYHFSISHCGDFAAAIVSRKDRVGIDIEMPTGRVEKVKTKFLNDAELLGFGMDGANHYDAAMLTTLWSAKEAVFKWYGEGSVDFRQHIQLTGVQPGADTIACLFAKNDTALTVHYRRFDQLVLAWVTS